MHRYILTLTFLFVTLNLQSMEQKRFKRSTQELETVQVEEEYDNTIELYPIDGDNNNALIPQAPKKQKYQSKHH